MADFIISAKARNDLLGIGNYTREKCSEEQAERYVRMLLSECVILADNPGKGRSYEEYRPGLMGATCGKHVIFYRIISSQQIRIVRFLHERMDFPRHL